MNECYLFPLFYTVNWLSGLQAPLGTVHLYQYFVLYKITDAVLTAGPYFLFIGDCVIWL